MVPPNPSVSFDADLPARVSGLSVPQDRVIARLESVGAAVRLDGATLTVTAPSWRPDLTDPADFVEEVVRLEGYQNLPSTLPLARAGIGLTLEQRLRRRAGRALAALGLAEVLSYPFVGTEELDALGIAADDPRASTVQLANPLSDAAPLLRTTLLPGLVGAVKRNLSRGATDVAVAEIGLVFRGGNIGIDVDPPRPSVSGRPSDADIAGLEALLPHQPRMAAGIIVGDREPSGWWGSGRPADWSDAVAVVRGLAEELGVQVEVTAAAHAPWHPGRCAAISLAGEVIGHAGELHPRVIEATGLPRRAVGFELDLEALIAAAPAVATAPTFSTRPVAKEDLAVVVADDVPAADVRRALQRGGGHLVESVRLFDTYSGEQVGPGLTSMAFSLRLRAADRTLSAAEVATVRESALAAAQEDCGAVLRV